MADGVRLYATRPRGGPEAEKWAELSRGLMHLNIGIGLALYHQWFPGARRGLWIRDTSVPTVEELGPERIEARGTLTWARTRDDAHLATETYRLSARRERGVWRVLLLRIGEPEPDANVAAV